MDGSGWELAWLGFVFVLGGLVKGVIAFGLPLVTVPLLSQAFPVPTAIALSLVSVLASSVVQVHACRHARSVIRQVWPMIVPLALAIPVSARLASRVRPETLHVAIGVFIVILVVVQWASVHATLPLRRRSLALAAGGAVSGLFGGVTSFYSFPSVQLLVSMRLSPAEFVFATNAMFLAGSTSLGLSLNAQGIFTNEIFVLSLWALAPLMLGLAVGQRLRDRVPHEAFRRLVLAMLAATGVSLILRGL